MCKDYMSLEMASFISRLRVFAPKNCFITPSLWQMGPGEVQQSTQKKRKGWGGDQKVGQTRTDNYLYTFRRVRWMDF